MNEGMSRVLDYYGVPHRDKTGWQTIRCPLPGHEDRRGSARVNIEEDAWKCHGCGHTGNSIKLIMEAEHAERSSAEAIYAKITGTSYRGLRKAAEPGRRGSILHPGPRDFERGSGLLQDRSGPGAGGRPRVLPGED